MTVQELYTLFSIMLNKLDTNAGIFIPKSYFVKLYNSESLRWLAEGLKKDEDNIDINFISTLFVTDHELKQIKITKEFIEYDLPFDWFQIYGSYSFAERGLCKGIKIFNYEKKPGNLIPVLSDADSKSSFDYEEAIFILGDNKLKLYFDDYEIKKTFINYYREPKKIQMEGYELENGEPSVNIDPELDEFNCVQILNRVIVEVQREVENTEGVELSKDRIGTEF